MKYLTATGSQPVFLARLGQALKRLREAKRNVSKDTVAMRLDSYIARADSSLDALSIGSLFRRGGIDVIEESRGGVIDLGLGDLRLLARAYDAHRILLDPVLSAPVDFCVSSFNDTIVVADDNEFGCDSEYRTPQKCLAGVDSVSINWVSIDPHGFSDSHSHSGDELIIVLEGSVDVLLLNSGLRARLNAKDYIHFYAEQEHCVLNMTKTVGRVLVMRFFRSARRAEMLQRLNAKAASITAAARQELHNAIDPPERVDTPTQVLDRAGLGHLLQRLCDESYRNDSRRLTLDALARRGRQFGLHRSRLSRIHHSQSPILIDELLGLAQIYDIEPMVLVDFCFPAHRHAIAVRCRGTPEARPLSSAEMWQVPEHFLTDSRSVYRIPNKRLADSDTAVAFLELPPRSGLSPKNRHPGHEFLLALAGTVKLHFDGRNAELQSGSFAHFTSTQMHWVTNESSEPAELFVVRIYE